MGRILITVGGSVAVFSVDVNGHCDGSGLNEVGHALHDAIQRHSERFDTILVEDQCFGTGMHRVETHHGAGGCCWGYRLIPHFSVADSIELHDKAVASALAGEPVGISGLEAAFLKLENERDEALVAI